MIIPMRRTLGFVGVAIVACASLIPLAGARAESTTAPAPTLAETINEGISAGAKTIKLPVGRYRASDTIELKNVHGLTIDGQGSTIIMTSMKNAFNIEESSDLTIRGFTVDYDPLPFTQGVITAISADGKSAEFEIHAGYPPLSADFARSSMHVFDATTRYWKPGAPDFYPREIQIITPQKGRAVFGERQQNLAVGDLLAINIRKSLAVMIRRCGDGVAFDSVTFHSAPGLCILGRFNFGRHTFTNVRIGRGPRPAGATEDRLLSTGADGINYAMGNRGPLLDRCDLSFMGDDSLNVHGAALPVMSVESPTSVLVARPQPREEFDRVVQSGQVVRILAAGDFSILSRSRLAAMTALTTQDDVKRDDVVALYPAHMRGAQKYTVYRLQFDSPCAVKVGQWLDIPALNCPGLEVRNSYFHDHRARGLRIMGSDAIVENNRFERITHSAISLGCEYGYWREAGWVENAVISGNTLVDIGTGAGIASAASYAPGAISIFAATDSKTNRVAAGNQNITIENNSINGCSVSGIHAFGVNGLVLRQNTIINTNRRSTTDTGRDHALHVELPVETRFSTDVTTDR